MVQGDPESEAGTVADPTPQQSLPTPDSEPAAVLDRLERLIHELDELPFANLFRLFRLIRTRTFRRILSALIALAIAAFSAGAASTDKIVPLWNGLKARLLGATNVPDARIDLFERTPSFVDFSRQAKIEIFAGGPNLLWVVQNARKFLIDEMAAGKRVKIHLLIMADKLPQGSNDPNPVVGLIQRYGGEDNFARGLEFSVGDLREWQRDARQRRIPIEIRVAEFVPITFTIIDADTADGRLQLRPLPYRVSGAQRPSFEIHRADAPNAFEEYVRSFRALWAGASPIE